MNETMSQVVVGGAGAILATITGIIGFFVKRLYSSVDALSLELKSTTQKHHDLQMEIAKEYPTKGELAKAVEEFDRRMELGFSKMELGIQKLSDKLDSKQDKSTCDR